MDTDEVLLVFVEAQLNKLKMKLAVNISEDVYHSWKNKHKKIKRWKRM